MLTKLRGDGDQAKEHRQKRKFRLFRRVTTRSGMANPYERMEGDEDAEDEKKKAEQEGKNGKVSYNTPGGKEAKEKKKKSKKKKAWKRIRQAALTTCRYIGMGAAHLSPATAYSSPEYYVDPRYWDKCFSPSYKHKPPQHQTAHWTNNMVFSSW